MSVVDSNIEVIGWIQTKREGGEGEGGREGGPRRETTKERKGREGGRGERTHRMGWLLSSGTSNTTGGLIGRYWMVLVEALR